MGWGRGGWREESREDARLYSHVPHSAVTRRRSHFKHTDPPFSFSPADDAVMASESIICWQIPQVTKEGRLHNTGP